MAAVMATGVPNPAAPSIKAPKENDIRRACMRRSSEMEASEFFMTSNGPVTTDML
jgi:hypothetical protein